MRAATLEAHAIRAVEALRSGVSPEDDFTECKQQWPATKTARQLAGLCNKAAGETVVLIIGVQEKTGAVVNPGSTDAADWWAGMVGQFDQTPPDLLRHIVVPVGPSEFVHALAFGTDRAPYVVKREQNSLDVPFRDGTGTRSAHRHELLQMLLPSVDVPELAALNGTMTLQWRASRPPSTFGDLAANPQQAWLEGSFTVFMEHLSPRWAMMPAHEMSMRLVGDGVLANARIGNVTDSTRNAPDTYGAHSRDDGIMLTGPGKCRFLFRAHFAIEEIDKFQSTDTFSASAHFGVSGTARQARLDFTYVRSATLLTQTAQRKELAAYQVGGR